MLRVLLLTVFTVLCCEAAPSPHSCQDIYFSNILSQDGVFTITNRQDQTYEVYCEFHKGYGYTYVKPNSNVSINVQDLYTDNTHVLIRDLRKDGTQYEAKIEQIAAFSSVPLSIQYNSHTGYNAIQNPKMTPYIYVGFLPSAKIHRGQREGYRMNGNDLVYTNCDGNPNNYFAFLFNTNNVAPSAYHPTNSAMQHNWADRATAIPTSKYLPNDFFSFFELHFGGCGAYGTPQHIPLVAGAALGLRFDVTCSQPGDIAHASKDVSGTSVGSTVTYTCDVGYGLGGGDLTRTCSETGQWTGQTPTCQPFPCRSSPCQNGGLCFAVEGLTFVCECVGNFKGDLCETSN
ncbi:biological adhesion [Mactra antiquata]